MSHPSHDSIMMILREGDVEPLPATTAGLGELRDRDMADQL